MTSAILIGCGKFSGFDNAKSSSYYFSALKKTNINLIGIYDKNYSKALSISKKFKLKTNRSLFKLLRSNNPDMIIVNSAINAHYRNIKQIMSDNNLRTKFYVIEKPFVEKKKQFNLIIKKFSEKKINFIVNHTRRFDKNFYLIKKKLSSKQLPKEIHFNYYGKWVNNGIHIVDTIFFFMQDKKIKSIICEKIKNLIILKLIFIKDNKLTVFIKKFQNFNYQTFDIDIFYSNKRFQILNFGETILEFDTKKNKIGELELKKKKFLKINNYPLVNMLNIFQENNYRAQFKIPNIKKLTEIYNLFFKIKKIQK